ncbi:hypothetical protein F383_27633 [Gossypium arboreum]|uniref:Uncharacterized protein n=1 Tax=Gossypium arboreum TaxID=29729 RepID=A0A0B0PCG5_GOSAR|nr:hypothetical protein F383_27633 [Gossypium arboreum]
MHSINRLVP